MAEPVRISPADTKRMIDAGEAIVLDVVSPPSWEQLDVAISGAVRIPPDQIEARFAELPRNRAVVAYCT